MTNDLNYSPDAAKSSHDNAKTVANCHVSDIVTRARAIKAANFEAPFWTAEETAELRRLVAIRPELTFGKIADHFPIRSRNAVIGRARRLLLPGRSNARPGRPRKPREARAPRIRPPAERKARKPSLWSYAAPEPPKSGTVTIFELKRDMCRWAFPGGTYCAAGVADGLPYCLGHAHLVYRKTAR